MLNPWSLVDSPVWGGLGAVDLLEEVCHRGGGLGGLQALRFQKPPAILAHSLCFLFIARCKLSASAPGPGLPCEASPSQTLTLWSHKPQANSFFFMVFLITIEKQDRKERIYLACTSGLQSVVERSQGRGSKPGMVKRCCLLARSQAHT